MTGRFGTMPVMLPLGPKRPRLTSLALSGISLAGCGTTAPPIDHPKETASATPSTTATVEAEPMPTASAVALPQRKDPGIDLEATINARSVTSESLSFKVLYSWTTDAQLAELVNGSPLLTRSVSKKAGMSMFDDLVAAEAARGRDVAKLLWHETFAKKRFAWPSPYSALRGGDADGDYGKVLVRIELRPDAWILDYDRGVVHTLDGSARLTPAELAKHPERLAAVYHNGPGFREFIVVNEGMVARVDAGGSKVVREAMSNDIDLLQALAAHIEDTPGDVTLPQTFPRTSLFQEAFTSSELRKRAKALDAIRGLSQPAFEKALNADTPLDKIVKSFALGAPRATIPPYCKLVRRDKQTRPQFQGSFAMPRATQTTYNAVCEDPAGSSPTSSCTATSSPTPTDAVCTPVPAFAQ